MELGLILNDASLSSKAKAQKISGLITAGELPVADLITAAKKASDENKASLIEALELATRKDPVISTLETFKFASALIAEKSNRIKLESARVIGNIAHLYPGKVDLAISQLLTNAEHPGTVVRWSAAFALGQIILTFHPKALKLLPAIKALMAVETDNAIRKIYGKAIKAAEKHAPPA